MDDNAIRIKDIGVVIAMQEELALMGGALGDVKESRDTHCSRPVLHSSKCGHGIYVATCGAGELGAAAATQMLIERYGVDLIINIGYVGALSGFNAGECAVVEKVVHYDYDISGLQPENAPGMYTEIGEVFIRCDSDMVEYAVQCGLRKATLASGDKFISDSGKKASLIGTYHAEICDMEGAAVALTSHRNGVRCVLFKIVSDNADESSYGDFCATLNSQTQSISFGSPEWKALIDKGVVQARKAIDALLRATE